MEPEGDFNANMKDPNKKDLNAEYNTYVRAQESREDLYIRQARDYKAQIGEVKSRSAEKRAAKEAESTSPDHEVQQDHAYTKPEDRLGPDIGPDVTPDTTGERTQPGITDMDLSGYVDRSFTHFFTNEDRAARAVGANEVGPPIDLA
jgi:hypothetical protein